MTTNRDDKFAADENTDKRSYDTIAFCRSLECRPCWLLQQLPIH